MKKWWGVKVLCLPTPTTNKKREEPKLFHCYMVKNIVMATLAHVFFGNKHTFGGVKASPIATRFRHMK